MTSNPMSKNHLTLIQFILDQAPSAPVHKRISIYRGLATLCGDADEAKALEALADELEATEKRAQEFAFQFAQKTK